MKKTFILILSVIAVWHCHSQTSKEYCGMGAVKDKNKNLAAAIEDYTKAIELDPKNTDAYMRRAMDKHSMNDEQGAIDDYTKVIELDPKNVEAYDHRGVSRTNLKDYQAAMDDFNKAIELDARYAQAYDSKSTAKGEKTPSPSSARIYTDRGLAKIAMGQKDGGCQDLHKSLDMGYKAAEQVIKKNCGK